MESSSDLEQRLAFLGLGADDLQALSRLRPILEARVDDLVAGNAAHAAGLPA